MTLVGADRTEAFRQVAADIGYSVDEMSTLMGRKRETVVSWMNRSKAGPPQEIVDAANRLRERVVKRRIETVEKSHR